MLKNITIISIAIFISCILSSCSNTHSKNSVNISEKAKVNSVELYLGRASYSSSDFEQFKFSNGRLFAECGKIAGGRQAPQYQDVKKLQPEELGKLETLAKQALSFDLQHELKLDDPGKGQSMFDPGQFYLKIYTSDGASDIKTSLDSIAAASKSSEENLKKLAVELRSTAMRYSPSSSLCGNRKFYELG